MARPLRIQFPGAFYHVMCRGNKRQNIFLDNDDRYWFLRVLCESLEIYEVLLYFYVLMDNHFHVVVQTLRGNLSEFMRRFNITYTGWFNYHHNTIGHLYQGRYKAILVDADSYLLELSRYVHLNPIRRNQCAALSYRKKWEFLKRYSWSSLPGYVDKKRTVPFINYEHVIEMVGSRREYEYFLLGGLEKGIENPFEKVQYQTILGDADFVARVRSEYLRSGSYREQFEYRQIVSDNVDPEFIVECVTRTMGISVDDICTRHGNSIVRGIVSDLLYRYSGISQRVIGQYLGIDYSSVSKLRKRLSKRMEHDNDLVLLYRKLMTEIKQQLSNVEI